MRSAHRPDARSARRRRTARCSTSGPTASQTEMPRLTSLVQVGLGPAPVGLVEAVGAVPGDGHRCRLGADRVGQRGQRGQDPEAAQGGHLGQVVARQPELVRVTGVEQEHHHPPSDPPHLAQAGDGVAPVVDGAHRHGGVEGLVVERQGLGRSRQARRCVRRALRAHQRRRFHGEDVAVRGLVGPGARPDVQHRPGVAERGPDLRGDAWLGPPRHRVGGSDGVVQLRRPWSQARPG